MKVEPAPEVSQLPETSQAPVVIVMIPLEPPVMVTLFNLPAEAFAVRTPASPMVRFPLSDELPSWRSAVASSVVELASETVRVPLHRIARVDMVKV